MVDDPDLANEGAMARRARLTGLPLAEELPSLLAERRWSLRKLAEQVGVNHAHLSRVLRGANGKSVSGELARRIAVALDLPDDYFPEYREAAVIELLRADPALRDRIYRGIARR